VIKYGGQMGVREIVLGMAHRGRLNVLANVMAKPYRVIFHEFAGGSANPRMSAVRATSNITSAPRPTASSTAIKVHMSLVAQPVAPRGGRSGRARQGRAPSRRSAATMSEHKVLPILIHGDAAFAGQGIVMECLGFSGHPRLQYRRLHPLRHQQPGRLHHQPAIRALVALSVGHRQGVQAPILHVNGDDPEAVTFACKVAIEFRQSSSATS
jgi:2-oxoglutarate dehydrogenase E1 component